MDRKQLIKNLKACAGGKACVGCSLFDTPNDCIRRLMDMAADALEAEDWIPVGETGPALTLQKDVAVIAHEQIWASDDLLLAVDGKTYPGLYERYADGEGGWFVEGIRAEPTHWRPMPEAPNE